MSTPEKRALWKANKARWRKLYDEGGGWLPVKVRDLDATAPGQRLSASVVYSQPQGIKRAELQRSHR
jgi:hypothetical protein